MTELRKIEWSDQDGKQRVWEAAARKTRKSTGVDAVAIVPILKHPSKPVSTMIIVQYRPPVEAFCVEFPAGLIDDGESPEQAAVRELREETGYSGKVSGISPTLSSQPGMTSANMVVRDLLGCRLQPDDCQRSGIDERQHADGHRGSRAEGRRRRARAAPGRRRTHRASRRAHQRTVREASSNVQKRMERSSMPGSSTGL